MKFFELIAKGIGKVWGFCTRIVTIVILAVCVLFILTVLMPDNMLNAIEIVKGIIG